MQESEARLDDLFRIRPVEEAGKMLEWDWGSERLAIAESCLPSRVAEARRLVAQELKKEDPYQLVGRHSGLPACCGGAAGRGRARPGPRRLAADERARAARQNGGGGDCGDGRSVVQRSGVCRLSSHFAHARAARPASLREGMSLPRFDPAAKSCSLEPRPTLPSRLPAAVELSTKLVPHMLPPCGCCQRAWRSAVLQGSADSILPRNLLPLRLGTRM